MDQGRMRGADRYETCEMHSYPTKSNHISLKLLNYKRNIGNNIVISQLPFCCTLNSESVAIINHSSCFSVYEECMEQNINGGQIFLFISGKSKNIWKKKIIARKIFNYLFVLQFVAFSYLNAVSTENDFIHYTSASFPWQQLIFHVLRNITGKENFVKGAVKSN